MEKGIGKGTWKLRQFRNGQEIDSREVENLTTYVGQNYALAAAFNGGTQISTWYAGLINNASYTGGAVTDTMSSHPGWTEWTSYTQSVRPTWGSGTPSSGSITNSSVMTFTMNASGALIGLFLTSVDTIGGTSGTLWNVAAITTGPLTVVSGDVITVTYTYTLT